MNVNVSTISMMSNETIAFSTNVYQDIYDIYLLTSRCYFTTEYQDVYIIAQ